MIGSGLKKLAKQHNMAVSSGVAYGSLMGYATTLSEGAGYKRIDISTKFPEGMQERFQAAVNAVDVTREYRVQNLGISTGLITVIFQDTIGTMKKIEAFMEWFFPLLTQHGASRFNVCAECGTEAIGGSWYLINGIAYYFHETCAAAVVQTVSDEQTQRRQEDHGSYVTGAVGAFIGAALGAVVWALVLYSGYIAALVGLLIGWLAERGYTLLKGKQGKGKVVILILAVIFGVVVGTMAPDVVYLVQMINDGGLPGFGYGDIPYLLVVLLQADAEYLRGTLSNIGIGMLMAALGVFGLLHKAGKETADIKVKKLN